MRIRRDSYLEHDSRQQQDGAGAASIFSGSRFFPAHYGGEGSSDAVAEYERYSGRDAKEDGELPDNVHAFTYYCITGRNHPDGDWKEFELDDALESAFGKPVSWRPIESD